MRIENLRSRLPKFVQEEYIAVLKASNDSLRLQVANLTALSLSLRAEVSRLERVISTLAQADALNDRNQRDESSPVHSPAGSPQAARGGGSDKSQ